MSLFNGTVHFVLHDTKGVRMEVGEARVVFDRLHCRHEAYMQVPYSVERLQEYLKELKTVPALGTVVAGWVKQSSAAA